MRLSTPERIVLGRERLGSASAPTCNGLFDPVPVTAQPVDDVGAPDSVGEHGGLWVRVDGDNHETIPGSTVPIDPRTVRRIREDTSAVLAS